jgi:hypothetical protein
MRKNLFEKCCVGTVIYSDKCGKTAVRETVDAEINNLIYMELYSGAKMADSKYQKTYVAGLIDRENTVIYIHYVGRIQSLQEMQHYNEINPCFEIIIVFQSNINILLMLYIVLILRSSFYRANPSCMFVALGSLLFFTLTPNAYVLSTLRILYSLLFNVHAHVFTSKEIVWDGHYHAVMTTLYACFEGLVTH